MKKLIILLCVVLASAMIASASTVPFSFSATGLAISGDLTVVPSGAGIFEVTGIVGGLYNGAPITGIIPCVLGGQPYCSLPDNGGTSQFNNLYYYPPQGGANVDVYGIDFKVDNNFLVNLYYGDPCGGYCIYDDQTRAFTAVAGSFGGQPTPEPSTLLMLGSGLIGLSGTIRRKLR